LGDIKSEATVTLRQCFNSLKSGCDYFRANSVSRYRRNPVCLHSHFPFSPHQTAISTVATVLASGANLASCAGCGNASMII
jgi:hypothetical protein